MIRDYVVESFSTHDNAVESFLNMDDSIEPSEQYQITKAAYGECIDDYKSIMSKENSWEYIDDIYDLKKEFIDKYYDFAKKCGEMSTLGGVSGYGGVNDSIKLKIKDLCRAIDYNFPYGWKRK